MIIEKNKKYNLQNRLIRFSSKSIKFTNTLGSDRSSLYFEDQLIRSSSSVALNYGEAQAAESTRDFIHKIKLALKELIESRITMEILLNLESGNQSQLTLLRKECEELIAIFSTIIKNAKKREHTKIS